jgi:hypothetical protein
LLKPKDNKLKIDEYKSTLTMFGRLPQLQLNNKLSVE